MVKLFLGGSSNLPGSAPLTADTQQSQNPGVFGVDVTSPEGMGASIGQNLQHATSLVDGLSKALFGAQPVGGGQNVGGAPIISDIGRIVGGIPVVGQVVGGAGNVLGGLAEIPKAGLDAVGGALERVTLDSPDALNKQYDQITGETRAATDAAIAADPGSANHLKYQAVKKWMEANQVDNPQLYPELSASHASIADTFDQLFAIPGLLGRLGSRAFAGNSVNAGGMDRLDQIAKVKEGGYAFQGPLGNDFLKGTAGTSEVEDIAYGKWQSGAWTKDQALDFLTVAGQGPAHDVGLSTAASIALDPTVIGGVGAGLAIRGGTAALKIAQGAAKIADAERAFAAASLPGATEDVIAAGKYAERILEAGNTSVRGVGRIASKEGPSNFLRWLGENPYKALSTTDPVTGEIARTSLGTAAKVMHTIADPFSVFGGSGLRGSETMAVASRATSKAWHEVTGYEASAKVLKQVHGFAPAIMDQLARDIGVFSANLLREHLLDSHISRLLAQGMSQTLAGATQGEVADLIRRLEQAAPKDILTQLKERMIGIQKLDWNELDDVSLATRMEKMYSTGLTHDELLAEIGRMGDTEKAFLHAATYGRANSRFLAAARTAVSTAIDAGAKLKAQRLVLVAKNTLTNLRAEGIRKALTPEGLLEKAVAEGFGTSEEYVKSLGFDTVDHYLADYVKKLQAQYKDLSRVYVGEAGSAGFHERLGNFTGYLGHRIDDKSLITEITRDEIKQLHPELQTLHADMAAEWTYGFRPEQAVWFRADSSGVMHAGGGWADHVGEENLQGLYRGTFGVAHNLMGTPLAPLGGLIDHVDAAAQLLRSHVTSAMITDNARKRFMQFAGDRHGMSEAKARELFAALGERAQLDKITVRGLSAHDMWRETRGLLKEPQFLKGGAHEMNERDMLLMVLDAYEGDLRYVGYTQKLTGRAKVLFAKATGSNIAGQVSENLYPKVRFSVFNPIFQAQERIEGIVLNAQRGVSPAFGRYMDEVDRIAAGQVERMGETSLARLNDVDMAEQAAQQLHGNDLAVEIGKIGPPGFWDRLGLTDVKANKRVNMLRTYENNMGRSMRKSLGDATFDDIAANYAAIAGHTVTDGEVAVRMIAEKAWTGADKVPDVLLPGASFGEFAAAHSVEMFQPYGLGEMRPLQADLMTLGLGMATKDGSPIRSVDYLRRIVASEAEDGITLNSIRQLMEQNGFHGDYIQRFIDNLNFDWNTVWRQLGEKYKLSGEDIAALQQSMAGAAQLRHMTPSEYMSQVFAVKQGDKGIALHNEITLLTQPGKTVDDLMLNVAGAFLNHLDPSAVDTLIAHYGLEVQAETVGRLAYPPDLAQKFSESVMDILRGNRGAAELPPEIVPGVSERIASQVVPAARSVAEKYMADTSGRVVPDLGVHTADPVFGLETARAYDALPAAVVEPGYKPAKLTEASLKRVNTTLKTTSNADARTLHSFQAFVEETHAQAIEMRKAGVRIIPVHGGQPYASSAEMRADVEQGILKVFADDAWHPILTDAQSVEFRAVHDYMAHAANGVEFGATGELNAAKAHGAMYSPDALPAMLTETHGQNSFVNFSDKYAYPAQNPLDPTVWEATQKPPLTAAQYLTAPDVSNAPGSSPFGRPQPIVSPGLHAAPPEVQDSIMGVIANVQRQFGVEYTRLGVEDILAKHFGLGPGTVGVTYTARRGVSGPSALYMGSHTLAPGFWDGVIADAAKGHFVDGSLEGVTLHEGMHSVYNAYAGDPDVVNFLGEYQAFLRQRTFDLATAENVQRASMKQVLLRPMPTNEAEFTAMSAEYVQLDRLVEAEQKGIGRALTSAERTDHTQLMESLTAFLRTERNAGPSWYGSTLASGQPSEMWAELGVFAYGPDFGVANPARLNGAAGAPFRPWAKRMRDLMGRDTRQKLATETQAEFAARIAKSPGHAPYHTPQAPLVRGAQTDLRTVAEVNAAKAGTIYAPQKASLLPVEITDAFRNRYIGQDLSVNPDVARFVGQFKDWHQAAIARGLHPRLDALAARGGVADVEAAARYKALSAQVTRIPSDGAVPYNHLHQLAMATVGDNMRAAEADAFRLAYFARDRSFLERSINHPFFGLYPASYMWGKIAPELFNFMARTPFGVRTGALTYAASDMMKAAAIQREYDPEFQKKIDELGSNPVVWFLAYLLPSVPWDLGASAPNWARNVAQQGLDNQERVNKHQAPKPINFMEPVDRLSDYISPLRSEKQTAEALGALGDAAFGSPKEQKKGGGARTVPFVGSFPRNFTQQHQPGAIVTGDQLGSVLADEVETLRALLLKP